MKITLLQTNPTMGDIHGNTMKIRDACLAAAARGADLIVAHPHALLGCPTEDMLRQPDVLETLDAAKAVLAKAVKDCRAILVADDVPSVTVRGMEILLSPVTAPFSPNALRDRIQTAAAKAEQAGLPLIQVNVTGGQDDVVWDGGSFVLNEKGERIAQAPQWKEASFDCDLSRTDAIPPFADPLEEIWNALVLGLKDYTHKSGFTDVMLGLSGGMDSALVAAIAGDALGAEHVHCVRLPSRHTSELSNSAAEEMCALWGFPLMTLPIADTVAAAAKTLEDGTGGTGGAPLKKLTRENMQARARGYLLMTLSNDRGWLLLSTGNKSEIAVGYSTLYGDMCGGFNPLKDVYKTTVYALAEWRNRRGIVIPREIIDRPPSAELSPDQLDTDSLPPYPVLDAILGELIEHNAPAGDVIAKGFDAALVTRVQGMVQRAEYKRRQSVPGTKATSAAFARDRAMPIVNKFTLSQRDALRAML